MAHKVSKRFSAALEKVDRTKTYSLEDAVKLLKQTATAKFNETVEMAFRLGVDPRQADQMVRGTVSLPHGTGKSVRVAVFAKGEKEKEAQEAGADVVGAEELIKKITDGWTDFDAAIATPDMMRDVGKLGKILGPRGLMPSPKAGTVTFDLAKAIKEIKAGKIEYRVDKVGNVHVIIGKRDFTEPQLLENAKAVVEAIVHARPSSAKGNYLQNVTLTSTMGPGIRIDAGQLAAELK